MHTSHLYGAVYALIFNEEGKVLLSQRKNTGYYDGGRTLGVGGHIESGETAHQAMVREIEEEIDLKVTLSNIDPHHVLHRLRDDREYVDISFVVHERTGIPIISEPDKCSALERFDLTELPENMPPENFIFLEAYLADNKGFSEIDLRSS